MYEGDIISLNFGCLEEANLFRTVVFGQLKYQCLNCDIGNFESNDANLIHKDINFQLNQLLVFPKSPNISLKFMIKNEEDDYARYGTWNLIANKESSEKTLELLGLKRLPLGYINRMHSERRGDKVDKIPSFVKVSQVDIITSTNISPNKLLDWDGNGYIKISLFGKTLEDVFEVIKTTYEGYKDQEMWVQDEGQYSALLRKVAFDRGIHLWTRRQFYRDRSERYSLINVVNNDLIDIVIKKMKDVILAK